MPVTDDHYHHIREVKERMCHVSMNYPVEMDDRHDDLTQEDRSYELPDQQIIEVTHRKRITSAECMFNPSIVGFCCPQYHLQDEARYPLLRPRRRRRLRPHPGCQVLHLHVGHQEEHQLQRGPQ